MVISQAKQYGGRRTITFGSNTSTGLGARVIVALATAGSLSLSLPDARLVQKGWPAIVVVNLGSNAFAVKDAAGNTLVASLATTEAATFGLADNSTLAGVWGADVRTRAT